MGEMDFRMFQDVPELVLSRLQEWETLPPDSAVVSRVLQDGFVELNPQIGEPLQTQNYPPPLSGSLVYCEGRISIIQGRRQTDASLDKWEILSGKKMPAKSRDEYKRQGGALQLEGRCRVLGELTSGQAVLDRIAALPSDPQMRPLRRIRFRINLHPTR